MQLASLLKYGVSGLALALMMLSYWLLKNELKKEKPSSIVLRYIKGYTFMGLAFLIVSALATVLEMVWGSHSDVSHEELTAKLSSANEKIQNFQEKLRTLQEKIAGTESRDVTGKKLNVEQLADIIRQDMKFFNPVAKVGYGPLDEITYTVLLRSIFGHFNNFDCDYSILAQSLDRLVNWGILKEDIAHKVTEQKRLNSCAPA